MNWYIGQDIVCIKTHSEGIVKEGDCYVIKGLSKGCCNIRIDIGEKSDANLIICGSCRKDRVKNDNIHWISEVLFAPLDTLTDISEIEEILNQPIETLFQTN